MTRSRFVALYLLAWLPLALLYALVLGMQGSMTALELVWATLGTVGSAALLGLGVWYVSTRVPYTSATRGRFIAIHLASALAYTVLLNAEVALSIRFNAPAAAYEQYVQNALGWQFLYGLTLYGVIAGAAHTFQSARRLRAEEQRTARAEAMRVDAELRAIRSQLNPHFLFNTLHSITALVRIDPAQGEEGLEQFAALLRYALDANRAPGEEVRLEEELDFVRTYLALERLRLGDRLQVIEDIDPEALDCIVLAFALQPLVENAIRHGISKRSTAGTVRCSAHVVQELLVLEVTDDGPGADADVVGHASGVGLSAVRQRLETRWGARALMSIVTAPGDGFTVRITLPAETTRTRRPRAEKAPPPPRRVIEHAAPVASAR